MSVATELAGAISDIPADTVTVETPAPVTPETPAVPVAELEALKAENARLAGEIAPLKETASLVEKARQIFTKQEEGTPLSAQDKEIRSELLRIYPELKEVPNITAALNQIKQAAAVAQQNVAHNAWSYIKNLQAEHKIDDPETMELVGGNVRDWILKDDTRKQRYLSGDKEVLKEGFEYVVSKLYGPSRLAKKRETVQRVTNAPIVPSRGGVAGGTTGFGGGQKIDFSDRKSVRDALRSTFPVTEE